MKRLLVPLIILLSLFLNPIRISAQMDINRGMSDFNRNIKNADYAWGFGFKTTVVLVKNNQSEVRLSMVAAIAKPIGKEEFNMSDNYLFPSYHLELELYRGGLGAALGLPEYNSWGLEMRNGFLLTGGSGSPRVSKPTAHFLGYSARTLNDPYRWHLRLGAVFIRNFTHNRTQRVAVGSLGVDNTTLEYHNDGIPYNSIALGDKYDRWWSGSGEFSVYADKRFATFNRISLAYNIFTGFHPYSYEMARDLGLYYVPYPEKREQLYNQSRWTLSADMNTGLRFEAHILDNPYVSIQNVIHWLAKSRGGMSLHPAALENRYGYALTYQHRYVELH